MATYLMLIASGFDSKIGKFLPLPEHIRLQGFRYSDRLHTGTKLWILSLPVLKLTFIGLVI